MAKASDDGGQDPSIKELQAILTAASATHEGIRDYQALLAGKSTGDVERDAELVTAYRLAKAVKDLTGLLNQRRMLERAAAGEIYAAARREAAANGAEDWVLSAMAEKGVDEWRYSYHGWPDAERLFLALRKLSTTAARILTTFEAAFSEDGGLNFKTYSANWPKLDSGDEIVQAVETIESLVAGNECEAGNIDGQDAGPLVELTAEEFKVLRGLSEKAGVAVYQEDLSAYVDLDRKTVGECLKRLRDLGLAKRPDGKKRGDMITADGKNLLHRITSP